MSAGRTPRDCRAARDRMPLSYYGALSASEQTDFLGHLDTCRSCASEWAAMQRALDAVNPPTVFSREAEVDWQELARATAARARAAETERPWAGTAPLIADVPRSRPAVVAVARFATLAAAAVVAVILFDAWLRPARLPAPNDFPPPLTSLLESAHAIEDRLARQGATRYLSDSRAILVNLVGTAAPCRKADGQFDMTLEKAKSRQLLRRQNLYEGDLRALQDRRLATLVRQLESVLMQVTALGDCASAREIIELREQIESRQILLRIDLVTREMQGGADVV